jgi:O-acetyl-ADP-ribose deacetylase (regulator of RNase III)
MQTMDGDLIALAKSGRFDVIAHGCNCFCVMGAGIAAQIARHFPDAEAADLATTAGDRAKLGTCSQARVAVGAHVLHVVNAYTQHHYAGPPPLVDYEAVRGCMRWIRTRHAGRRIGLPMIGAGLAGGHWPTIAEVIDAELAGLDVTLVMYAPRR